MEAPKHRTKYKKSEKTRERLIRAALKIIEEKGYANTTIRDICAEAGMSIGAFYGQFKSKADLLAEHYSVSSVDGKWAESALKGETAVEKILNFVQNYALLNISTQAEHLWAIIIQGNAYAPIDGITYTALLQAIREGQESGEISANMTSEEIYIMLMTILRGCIYDWCIQEGQHDLEARTLQYIHLMLDALRQEKR